MKCDKFIDCEPAMSNFRPIDRSTGFLLLPPSVTDNGYFSEANVKEGEDGIWR
jgi:hypothetical protein